MIYYDKKQYCIYIHHNFTSYIVHNILIFFMHVIPVWPTAH